MNKFDKEINDDADFIQSKLKQEALPSSLSAESIQKMLENTKQKTPRHTVIRRIISGTVAACLVITGIFIYDYAAYSPIKTTDKNGNTVFAESYSQIENIFNDYINSVRFSSTINMYSGKENVQLTGEVALPDATYDAIQNGTSDNAAQTKPDSEIQHSDTNTQVEGVGEADIVKTDGKYIYLGTDRYLSIVKALTDGKTETASELDLKKVLKADDNERYEINDLYLFNNTLVLSVTCVNYEEQKYAGKVTCGSVVLDITDRSAPVLKKCFMQDGSYVSSRAIGNSLIFISEHSPLNYVTAYDDNFFTDVTADEIIPGVYNSDYDYEKQYVPADSISIANTEDPESFIVISKLNLDNLSAEPGLLSTLGGSTIVYCTTETLYTAASFYSFSDENYTNKTTVTSYDITGSKPVYKSTGSFEGTLLNNFSLDEYNGCLRAAAHLSDNTNCIYTFNSDLSMAGKLQNIAPDESIQSVRFMGSTGYVVTFYQTDPLFVIDLSDNKNPTIKGELKIPGFSSYLHPVGNGLMLGVGCGGTEEGLDGSAKLSLFDVTNPAEPKELDTFIIDNSSFEADYKAFVTVQSDGSFIIPTTKWDIVSTSEDDIFYNSNIDNRPGAIRVKIENGKIVLLNEYYYPLDCCNRAIYIENTVYAISTYTPAIASFNMQSGDFISEWKSSLEHEAYSYYWYCN